MFKPRLLLATLLLFVVVAGPVRGQERRNPIAPDLQQVIDRAQPGEFIRVIVRLRDQLPPASRSKALMQRDARERRRALTTALGGLTFNVKLRPAKQLAAKGVAP